MSEATSELLPPAEDGGSGGRRTAVIATVAVVVVALLGGSAFAVYKLFGGGGPQPDTVLPADTLAMVSIDLDPSARQKIEAIKAIRKFPSLKKELGLNADDDLRRFAFDKAIEGSDCKDLDYSDDVEPWLGKRAAFGAVDTGGKEPTPVLALQISDKTKARQGIDALADCGDPGDDFGYALTDDYAVISDSEEHAKQIVADGEKSSLADDEDYQKWTDAAGDRGVVNFYVAQKAAQYFVDHASELSDGEFGKDETDLLQGYVKDFTGLAGTVRFSGGGMELAAVTSKSKQFTGTGKAGKAVSALPADTALALGFSVPKGYIETMLDSMSSAIGTDADQLISEAETQTGLSIPEDLETLLGESWTVSLGGKAPASLDDVAGPQDIPAGLLVHGDVDAIEDVLSRLEERTGMSLSDLGIGHKSQDGKVVLATSEEYAESLLATGKLGSDDTFEQAVPRHDDASGVLFVDFDSDWVERIVEAADQDGSEDAEEVAENLKPLKSLGVSGWVDGDTAHVLVKLTTN